MNPLSGCGQSPPFPPRDGCVDSVASWSAKGYASVLPARLSTVPDGQSAPTPCSLSRHTKIRRANSEAPLPRRGKQRRFRTLAAYPCPRRARMRHSTRRRRQAPAPEPAAVCSHHRPNRTAPQHTRPLLMGRVCVNPAPKATGLRHCRRPLNTLRFASSAIGSVRPYL